MLDTVARTNRLLVEDKEQALNDMFVQGWLAGLMAQHLSEGLNNPYWGDEDFEIWDRGFQMGFHDSSMGKII